MLKSNIIANKQIEKKRQNVLEKKKFKYITAEFLTIFNF